MLNTTTFSVALTSIDFWLARFKKFGINYKEPQERFQSEVVVYFEDTDGLGLELVFNDNDTRTGLKNGNIPIQHSIKGLYNVEIWLEGYERTAGLLTEQLDHTLIAENGNRFRFAATDKPGCYVDLLCSPESMKGLAGSGTVHHIAFSTHDKNTQLEARLKIVKRMLNPTPVLDRNYFTSIYFREPGGVLFEVATAGPGFTIDESKDHLGEALQLPQQFEKNRDHIEKVLAPITINLNNYQ
jgi:glyoxalase family protein